MMLESKQSSHSDNSNSEARRERRVSLKFTPQGGSVEFKLARLGDQGLVHVRDTEPGITASERDLVARRFYRTDKSRNTRGIGLGLSLVTAIVKLHGFHFTISPGPGCLAEIDCPQAPA